MYNTLEAFCWEGWREGVYLTGGSEVCCCQFVRSDEGEGRERLAPPLSHLLARVCLGDRQDNMKAFDEKRCQIISNK